MLSNSNKTSRRQFFRNTTALAISLGVLPKLLRSKPQINSVINEDCNIATLDYYGEGPFYTENPPIIENNQLAAEEEPGTRLIISGRIYNLDCTEVIPNAVIDIWHANDNGQYDNEGYNLRGQTTSNEQGFYIFETINPGKYLNGNSYRPSHIHIKITPPEFETLTTQLYFEGDTEIEHDAAASISSGDYDATHRIIPLSTNNDNKLEGTWDVVINGDGISTAVNDLHIEKGMIYSAAPNPFTNKLSINYGVFKDSKVSLSVFDIQGKLVANVEERNLQAEKYDAIWEPDQNLPNGIYFVSLIINDLQVHYQKVLKQS